MTAFRLGLSAFLLAFVGGSVTAGATTNLQLVLVPDKVLHSSAGAGELLAAALPQGEGTVYLYRDGDPSPRITASTAGPIPLEGPGMWLWHAEAPGWVTVKPGRINAGRANAEKTRQVFWPVVPACTVSLADDAAAWRGVQQVDFVSLEHGSIHRLILRERRQLKVPAGRFLYYTQGQGRLLEVSDLFRCRPAEPFIARRPDLPERHLQDLMVSMTTPESYQGFALDAFETVYSASGRSYRPVALVEGNRRVTAFLLDVPAEVSGTLRVAHPELVTAEVAVAGLGGSARELAEMPLQRRRELELTLHYAPIRPHELARLEVIENCAERGPGGESPRCSRLVHGEELKTGTHTYTIRRLDEGDYRVDAVVDDDVIYALGAGVVPRLSAAEPTPEYPLIELREFELYGHILYEGDPVPGEVVFQPATAMPTEGRRVFPTDEGLEYRVFYFGRSIVQRDPAMQLSQESSRPLAERLGLDRLYEVIACTTGRVCRSLRPSVIRGGGRLDIEITAPPRLAFSVTDAETGEAIEEATCGAAGHTGHRLEFVDGEADWDALFPLDRELLTQRILTDGAGQAVLYGPPEELRLVTVRKEGYRPYRRTFDDGSPRDLELEVALEREVKDGPGLVLRSTRGEVLGGALVVSCLPGERIAGLDLECTGVADARGEVWLGEGCLADREVVVFDPRVRLRSYGVRGADRGSDQQIELRLPAVQSPAPRVRVVDEVGEPVEGLFVQIENEGLRLSTNDLILAVQKTGKAWPYRTDPRGEITLLGIETQGLSRGNVQLGSGDGAVAVAIENLLASNVEEVLYTP